MQKDIKALQQIDQLPIAQLPGTCPTSDGLFSIQNSAPHAVVSAALLRDEAKRNRTATLSLCNYQETQNDAGPNCYARGIFDDACSIETRRTFLQQVVQLHQQTQQEELHSFLQQRFHHNAAMINNNIELLMLQSSGGKYYP